MNEIFISESMGKSTHSVIEDGTLVEVYIEKQDHQRMLNIYNGIVENVLPGMQAAFVDIGYDINAFYHFQKLRTLRYFQIMTKMEMKRIKRKNNKRPNHKRNDSNVSVNLKTGQNIYVQLSKRLLLKGSASNYRNCFTW